MSGEWAIKLKHRLQLKFMGIMFISLLGGLFSMALAEALYFGKILGISPEEAELAFPEYSPFFNAVFIIISIILFLLLSRRLIKRIEEMNMNVKRIAAGKMTGLAEDKSKDELGSLSRNINAMAEMIQESLQKEKNMICDLAHDLRTPITSITGYVELLEQSSDLSDQAKEYLDIIYRKSNDLSVQVNDLLEYSVLQYRKKEYHMAEISLSSLLEQVIIDFIPSLEKEKMTFLLIGNNKPHFYKCNQGLMVRLFENLITNSIKYGKSGGKLDICIEEHNETIVISFSNYGTVLLKEYVSCLFQAFYQAENTLAYKTESNGLGLPICKAILEIHGGTIEAVTKPELKKVIFVIKL